MRGADEYKKHIDSYISKTLSSNLDKSYLKSFVNYIKLNRSEYTVYNYLRHVIDFIEYTNKPIVELVYADYLNYESEFLDKTASYRMVKHTALKVFSEYLHVTKYTEFDVYKDSPSPKCKESIETIEKRENNYLEPDDIRLYLQHVNQGFGTNRALKRQSAWRSRDKAIVVVLLTTGMRCSALYKLDISDINFETKRFTIKEKGKNRIYILNDFALGSIKDWLVDRERILNGKSEDALFISNQLTRLSMKAISNITVKYGNSVKDIHLTPHKLRATFGTNFYTMTGDIYATKEAMGHSNITMTEIYIRGQNEKSSQLAADKMQELCVSLT